MLRVLLRYDHPELRGEGTNGRPPTTFLVLSGVPVEILKMMLDCPAVDVNATDDQGRNLLAHALDRQSADVVRLLMERMDPEVVARTMAKVAESDLAFLKS